MPAQAAPVANDTRMKMRSIGLTVENIDASVDFFAGTVPLTQTARYVLPATAFGAELLHRTAGDVDIAHLSHPTGELLLYGFADAYRPTPPVPVQGPGYTHMCIQSPSDDPALTKFCARGLEMISWCDETGIDLGGYGVRYAYGRDREGRMLEVELLDRPHRSGPGWIAHLANTVHDHAAMLGFYEKLTGTPPWRVFEQAAGRTTFDAVAGVEGVAVKGAWFRIGDLEIEVWQYLSPATPAPVRRHRLDEIGYNAPLFGVVDLAAEQHRLTGLGIALIGEPVALGGLLTQYAADPEGNLIGLQQRV